VNPTPTAPDEVPKSHGLLILLLVVTMVASLGAVWFFDHGGPQLSLFELTNLVGPTTQSLLHGGGLTACTEAMGTPGNPICFHAGRMPLPSLVVGLGIQLFGDRFLAVNFFKTILLLLPLEIAIYLVWLRMPRSRPRRVASALLLLAPFATTAFIADVVNLQVEEGYSYSFLALAVALLLFAIGRTDTASITRAVLFAVAVDGTYLAKSSMAPAVAVLLLSYLLLERHRTARILVLLLVAAAPIGWALHQHHASHRYSIGTSIDGMNLHKANNPEFVARYPPPPGASLDQYDSDLNRGLHFDDEWSFNDFHQHAAIAFLLAHPADTLHADMSKLGVIFFSVRKYGSSESHGTMLRIETAGLLLFRLILWTAIVSAVIGLFKSQKPQDGSTDPSLRAAGAIFLALLAACILPYVVGFAYTRHVSILIYPAVLMCCRMLQDGDETQLGDRIGPQS
jgi:hypothetical protein